MKIYPSSHKIVESDRAVLKDIPLAYIDTADSQHSVNIAVREYFAQATEVSQTLKPYDEFTTSDLYFFTDDGEIADLSLKRVGNRYIYEPQNMTEFSPMLFSCSALVKKNMSYRSDANYNLRIAAYEENTELNFSNQLISVFGDAPRRGLCPPNISVNKQSMLPQSLINSSYRENDFIFIKTLDGIRIRQGQQIATLDIEAILNEHVNLWLSVEEFEDTLKEIDNTTFTLAFPVMHTKVEYELPGYTYLFDVDIQNSNYPKSTYTYHNMFIGQCPALVLQKPGKGYIIITHNSFFDSLHANVQLLYELLMGIFLKAYYQSSEVNSWITDQPIDYLAYKYAKYSMRHETINLSQLLKNNDYDLGDDYSLEKVETSNENILFMNMNSTKDMFFYKVNNIQPDPKKKDGDFSYFTSKYSVIHCPVSVIKKVESGLKVESKVNDTGEYITIGPLKSTKHKINIKKQQTLRIPDKKKHYYLICLPSLGGFENLIKLCEQSLYTEEAGIILCSVRVISNVKTKLHDIRIKGGGLPLDAKPDFNMIDIGNINGRQYRRGSTMIIRLPKKCEKHKQIINDELSKHVSSGDYPILTFD